MQPISTGSVWSAPAGRYRREALAELPAVWAERYFEEMERECRVIERVRRRVMVRAADLSNDPPPRRNYQLILCRNVVIYFERAAQERVFATFAEALAPGGFLVWARSRRSSGRPAIDSLCWTRASGSTGGPREWPGAGGPGGGPPGGLAEDVLVTVRPGQLCRHPAARRGGPGWGLGPRSPALAGAEPGRTPTRPSSLRSAVPRLLTDGCRRGASRARITARLAGGASMFAALAPPGTYRWASATSSRRGRRCTSTVCRWWGRRWAAISAARSGSEWRDGRVEVSTVAHGVQHL